MYELKGYDTHDLCDTDRCVQILIERCIYFLKLKLKWLSKRRNLKASLRSYAICQVQISAALDGVYYFVDFFFSNSSRHREGVQNPPLREKLKRSSRSGEDSWFGWFKLFLPWVPVDSIQPIPPPRATTQSGRVMMTAVFLKDHR